MPYYIGFITILQLNMFIICNYSNNKYSRNSCGRHPQVEMILARISRIIETFQRILDTRKLRPTAVWLLCGYSHTTATRMVPAYNKYDVQLIKLLLMMD